MTEEEAGAALEELVRGGWLVYDDEQLDDDDGSATFGQMVRCFHWNREGTGP